MRGCATAIARLAIVALTVAFLASLCSEPTPEQTPEPIAKSAEPMPEQTVEPTTESAGQAWAPTNAAIDRWRSHFMAGLSLMGETGTKCADWMCIDEKVMAACRWFDQAERASAGGDNLYFRDPLLGIDAACHSLERELEAGIPVDYEFWTDDIWRYVIEVARRLDNDPVTAAQELDEMWNGTRSPSTGERLP